MEAKSGKISVTTENIFPVIRQWLYEDKDIFVRELVSNCADAIAKHRRLVELGKAEKEPDNAEYSIRVIYDDDNKTISFEDNGIGMTENEVEKYINQIAFSGALDFVTKYQEESTDKTGIIGHFGLGFYSAFMVADEVTINTKSFMEDAEPVIWKSKDGMDFEILPSDKADRGTVITLKLSEDAIKIFDSATVRMTIRKYCYFAPADIYFVDTKSDRLHEEAEEKRKKEAEEKGETFTPSPVSYVPVNNKSPLWTKKPSECTESEYKQFYHSVFNDGRDPLLGYILIWIIRLHFRVFFISRRQITFTSRWKEGSRSTTIRYSLLIISKRSFRISFSCFRDASTVQIFLLMFHVRLCSRMNMLRNFQDISSRKSPINLMTSLRSSVKTLRNTGLIYQSL